MGHAPPEVLKSALAERAVERVVEVGKKRYVLGADWLAYLSRVADEQESG